MDRSQTQLKVAIGALTSLFLVGTLGYRLLEGWSWVNSAYMTVITLTTVGFGEVEELSRSGRMFTIGLVMVGFGTAAYAAALVGQRLLDSRLSNVLGIRRMSREIQSLKDDIIVCGYGSVGHMICEHFRERGVKFVVIEHLPEQAGVPADTLLVQGEATEDETLEKAGIKTARSLVCALSDEATSVYLTLSARQLNPSLFITTRADTAQLERKHKRAGANRVISPYQAGAHRMAVSTLRPNVMDFMNVMLDLETAGLELQEVTIPADSPLVGQTLGQADLRRRFDLMVVAIKHPKKMVMGPASDVTLREGDDLVLIGSTEDMERMAEWAFVEGAVEAAPEDE